MCIRDRAARLAAARSHAGRGEGRRPIGISGDAELLLGAQHLADGVAHQAVAGVREAFQVLRIGVVAVSYTHLDVYKRQASESQRLDRLVRALKWALVGAAVMVLVFGLFIWLPNQQFSYTCLLYTSDVYKRQLQKLVGHIKNQLVVEKEIFE